MGHDDIYLTLRYFNGTNLNFSFFYDVEMQKVQEKMVVPQIQWSHNLNFRTMKLV